MMQFHRVVGSGIRLIFSRVWTSRSLLLLSTSAGKSSKEIEYQMKLQRWKNLQKEKSFTTLNPTKPTTVREQYDEPRFISYNLDSLREYSHKYPEFLLKELSNLKSQFHELIQNQITNFWAKERGECIEYALFFDGWDIKDTESVESWVSNHADEFTLEETFKLLKTKYNVWKPLENAVIKKLGNTVPMEEYDVLFKILNYYRLKGLGEESFFQSLEEHFVKNIKNLSGSNLVRLLIHYANNINESMESKIRILQLVEQRIFAVSKFLNADELISVLFCFLKLSMANEPLIQEIEERILLNITMFKPEQLVKVMNLCCSLPKRQEHILSSIIAYVFKDKLDPKVIPTLYHLAIEYSLFTEEFLKKVEPILIGNIHVMEPDDVAKCCWAFSVVEPQKKPGGIVSNILGQPQTAPSYLQFYKKTEEIIQGGLRDYNVRQVCTIVWALSSKNYNPKGEFWGQIESWFQEQLQRPETTVREATLVMWAYTNNRHLLGKTVQQLLKLSEEKVQDMEPFDVSTCCWFASQLAIPAELTDGLLIKLHQRFT